MKHTHSVKNGRYKHCLTIGLNSSIGCYHWWACISNIRSCLTFGCTKGLSSIVGSTMATHNQYQAELAEKSSDIPEGQN